MAVSSLMQIKKTDMCIKRKERKPNIDMKLSNDHRFIDLEVISSVF